MQTISSFNPLGAKGIGEAATIGSTPAVLNAVVDAVSYLGVRHIEMPATAHRVWDAIQAAQTKHTVPNAHAPLGEK
jgi:carbon-monoxide dehydrogenase large subunit